MPGGERTEQIEREIAALETYCEELAEAIDELEHNTRRCRDRLERAGGDPHQIARALKQLTGNRDLNRRELEKSRRRIDELKAVLAKR